MTNVLIVEDEQAIRRFLRTALEGDGMRVFEAETLQRGLLEAATRKPDLIILDLGLPDGDGIEFIRDLRQWSAVPVIVLSARSEESDKIAALDAGADDYLPKPFALEELLARVRSLLRRAAADSIGAPHSAETELSFEDLQLDADTREVKRGDRHISLTRTEFALLQLLMENPRKVMPRNVILEEVWGYDFPTSGNALEVYIGYLRKKTEGEGESRLIHTVRGVGYVLRESTP